MIFLSLHINIIMRNFYAILALSLYNLLFVMLIHDFGVINDIKNKLIFQITVCIAVLISD
jgi:hypothetical protein